MVSTPLVYTSYKAPEPTRISLNFVESDSYYMWPGLYSNASESLWGWELKNLDIPQVSVHRISILPYTPPKAPTPTKISFQLSAIDHDATPIDSSISNDRFWGLEAKARLSPEVTSQAMAQFSFTPPNAPAATKLSFPTASHAVPQLDEETYTNAKFWNAELIFKMKLIPELRTTHPNGLSINGQLPFTPPHAPGPTQLHFDPEDQKISHVEDSNGAFWGIDPTNKARKVLIPDICTIIPASNKGEELPFAPPQAPPPTRLNFNFTPDFYLKSAKKNGLVKAELYSNDDFWGIEVKVHDLLPKYFDTTKPLQEQPQEDVDQLMMLLRQRYPLISGFGLEQHTLELLDRLLKDSSAASRK